jgi:hypothetical protein
VLATGAFCYPEHRGNNGQNFKKRREVTDEIPIDDDIPIPKQNRERKDKTKANARKIAVNSVLIGECNTSAEAAERFMPEYDKYVTEHRHEDAAGSIRYTNRKRDFRKSIDAELKRSHSTIHFSPPCVSPAGYSPTCAINVPGDPNGNQTLQASASTRPLWPRTLHSL